MIIPHQGVKLISACQLNLRQCNPKHAIVLPARNEEENIPSCLRALSQQRTDLLAQSVIIIVANNCADATVRQAKIHARSMHLSVCVLELEFKSSSGVGLARKLGTQAALGLNPAIDHLLTSDADCLVAPNWLERNIEYLEAADLVCGDIRPDANGVRTLPMHVQLFHTLQRRYRENCEQFQLALFPNRPQVQLQEIACGGASLAFRLEALLRCGGFSPVSHDEDREILARARQNALRVKYATDVQVFASCRLLGRAPFGMAATLAAAQHDPTTLVDKSLLSVDELVQKALYLREYEQPSEPTKVNHAPMTCDELRSELGRLTRINFVLQRMDDTDRWAYLAGLAPLTQFSGLRQVPC